MQKKRLLLIFVIALIVGAIFYLERLKQENPFAFREQKDSIILPVGKALDEHSRIRVAEKEKRFPRAKELVSPEGYINTERFDLRDLVGKKVILLDFWTYSCINCQRTLPYLKAWYQKYKDGGLVIIGIHSPEFNFEKDYANVSAAVKKWGISYPVVLDNHHESFKNYDTVFWPSEFLIDIDGFIVHKNIGEGGYEETERKIQELLNERRAVLGQEAAAVTSAITQPQEAVQVNFFEIGTPEIYLGSQTNRGYFGNPEGLVFGKDIDYKLPGTIKPNEVYAEGLWHNGPDYLELKADQGKIILSYQAKVVNIVAGALKGEVHMKIKVDGQPLTDENRGRDVLASGVAVVNHFDLYNIVSYEQYGRHRLEIEVEGAGFAAYALTFG